MAKASSAFWCRYGAPVLLAGLLSSTAASALELAALDTPSASVASSLRAGYPAPETDTAQAAPIKYLEESPYLHRRRHEYGRGPERHPPLRIAPNPQPLEATVETLNMPEPELMPVVEAAPVVSVEAAPAPAAAVAPPVAAPVAALVTEAVNVAHEPFTAPVPIENEAPSPPKRQPSLAEKNARSLLQDDHGKGKEKPIELAAAEAVASDVVVPPAPPPPAPLEELPPVVPLPEAIPAPDSPPPLVPKPGAAADLPPEMGDKQDPVAASQERAVTKINAALEALRQQKKLEEAGSAAPAPQENLAMPPVPVAAPAPEPLPAPEMAAPAKPLQQPFAKAPEKALVAPQVVVKAKPVPAPVKKLVQELKQKAQTRRVAPLKAPKPAPKLAARHAAPTKPLSLLEELQQVVTEYSGTPATPTPMPVPSPSAAGFLTPPESVVEPDTTPESDAEKALLNRAVTETKEEPAPPAIEGEPHAQNLYPPEPNSKAPTQAKRGAKREKAKRPFKVIAQETPRAEVQIKSAEIVAEPPKDAPKKFEISVTPVAEDTQEKPQKTATIVPSADLTELAATDVERNASSDEKVASLFPVSTTKVTKFVGGGTPVDAPSPAPEKPLETAAATPPEQKNTVQRVTSPAVQIIPVMLEVPPKKNEAKLSPESKQMLAALPSHLGEPDPQEPEPPLDIAHSSTPNYEVPADKTLGIHEAQGVKIEVREPGLQIGTLLEEGYNALQAEDLGTAMNRYQMALGMEPKNNEAKFGLAATYHRMGELVMARDLYAQIVASEPGNLEAMNNLLVLVSQESPKEALAELKKLEQRNPHFSPVPAQMAAVYAQLKEFEPAVQSIRRAIQLAPDNLAYRYNAAVLMDRAGRRKEAIELYLQLKRSYEKGLDVPADMAAIQERLTFLLSNRG